MVLSPSELNFIVNDILIFTVFCKVYIKSKLTGYNLGIKKDYNLLLQSIYYLYTFSCINHNRVSRCFVNINKLFIPLCGPFLMFCRYCPPHPIPSCPYPNTLHPASLPPMEEHTFTVLSEVFPGTSWAVFVVDLDGRAR